ncbi:MAG: hypothetical protein M3Y49_19625 [Actinomycetota bacterium]|nr:hypothetical protein [Actinomycetota bacterium]
MDRAQRALKALPSVVREGAFAQYGRKEEWRPDYDEGGRGVEEAEQRELIMFNGDEGYYDLNDEEPLIAAVQEALEDLFRLAADDELSDWFRATYGRPLRRQNRQVWEALNFL